MSKIVDSSGNFLKAPGSTTYPFQNGNLYDIAGAVGSSYGEPTALSSDDGTQIDIWCSYLDHSMYFYSTNGSTFAGFTDTVGLTGYLRQHILKVGSTYYFYATGGDTSIHLFTSTNKINFTDQGQVLGLGSAGAWDDTNLGNMFVWVENGNEWYMLYEANHSKWQIGLATASAPEGSWTKYGSNPVITGTVANGAGNPELPRLGSTVLKSYGKYYCYYHSQGASGGDIYRAYSTDLHTWTVEGVIDGVRRDHSLLWTYGDHCLVQFNGHTYLFWTPSNQVDSAHIDGAIDNRPESQLLLAPCSGGYTATPVMISN